jgi:hypothetical protein
VIAIFYSILEKFLRRFDKMGTEYLYLSDNFIYAIFHAIDNDGDIGPYDDDGEAK